MPAEAAKSLWHLDPEVTFLNHGSFGACPREVLAAQAALRERVEREPVRFFVRELEALADAARAEVAAFVDADADDLAFVTNATTGVAALLSSLAPSLAAGDELLCTDHGYNACWNALVHVAEARGARVVRAEVPFPLTGDDDVVAALCDAVTPRTRLALVDHVTSPTGLIFPIERIARELAARGVPLLVDGAHAPGMLSLSLRRLGEAGAGAYTGNFHKWCCAPKGAAMLWVRRDLQARIRPPVISHGANSPRRDRSRFRLEFDWVGTGDWTAALSVPAALRFMAARLPGGWDAVRAANRAKALRARRTLAAALGVAPPCPDEMIGALASLPLPDGEPTLQARLEEHWRIQVPIVPWPRPGKRLVRVSAQLYNTDDEYARLGEALRAELAPGAL